jgi:hypothetical protein
MSFYKSSQININNPINPIKANKLALMSYNVWIQNNCGFVYFHYEKYINMSFE